jgi:murein DD-endopeptidase MepM/ murein hydrolase activator NlpD
LTYQTARPEPRPAPPAHGDAAPKRTQRADQKRRTGSRTTQARSAKRPAKRHPIVAAAKLAARLAIVAFGAAFAWTAAIGAESAMAPGVPLIAIPEAAAASSISMACWALDANNDGIADLANPTNGAVRAHDLWGSGEYGAARSTGKRKRIHAGADYVAYPGQLVRAPIAGEVTKIGFAYKNDRTLRFVEITNRETRRTVRVLYVKPSVQEGQTLAATDPIGGAQNLNMRYPGITNHVHVELMDARGRHQDPALVLPNTPQFVVARQAPAAEPSPS